MSYDFAGMPYRLHNDPVNESIPQDLDRFDDYLQEGRLQDLRVECEEGIASLGQVSNGRYSLAIYRLFLGLVELREGRFQKALEVLSPVIPRLPGGQTSDILKGRVAAGIGRALIGLNKLDEAFTVLKGAQEEFPESAEVWAALGLCHRVIARVEREQISDPGTIKNHSDEAWRCFLQAAQLSPTDISVAHELAGLGFTPERYRPLAEALRVFLIDQPHTLDIRAFLSLALLLDGQVEMAREEMERVDAFAAVSVIDPGVLATVRDALNAMRRVEQEQN